MDEQSLERENENHIIKSHNSHTGFRPCQKMCQGFELDFSKKAQRTCRWSKKMVVFTWK